MASKANRRPTPEERKELQVRIQRDRQFLNLLNNELASRLQDLDVTDHALKAATFTFKQAQLRLSTAQSHRDYVEASIKALDGRFTCTPNPSDSSSQSTPSPHLLAAEKTISRHQEMLKEMRNWLEQAKEGARDAKQAAAISEENLECARNLHKFSKDILLDIEQQVQAVESSLSQKKLACRAIWDVPDEIWTEIFELVTENNDPKSELQLYGIDLMILMSVCSSWRVVIRSNTALHARIKFWASIDEVTIPKGVQDEARIFTSISYCFTGLTTLEVHGDAVDIVLIHLLTREDVSKGPKLTTLNIPLLTKLTITDYSGSGEELLKLTSERHDALHLVKEDKAALERADRMSRDPNGGESISKFIEWYFQREGAGIPWPKVKEDYTYTGYLYGGGYRSSPLYTVYLYMGSKRLGIGHGSSQEDARTRCFRGAKNVVLAMDGSNSNSTWQEFLIDVIAGKDGPTRLFNIELKNCRGIGSEVLRSLKPYMRR